MCDYLTAQNIEKIWLYKTWGTPKQSFLYCPPAPERDLKDEYFRTRLRAQWCPTHQNLKFMISNLTTVKKKKKKEQSHFS